MAKGRVGAKRQVIKRPLSRRERETRFQRLVFAVGIFVIIAVLVLVGSGWYLTQVKPFYQTVMKVNDTEIDMRFYVDTLVALGPGGAEEKIRLNELERQAALKLDISISDEEARSLLESEITSLGLPVNSRFVSVMKYKALTDRLLAAYFEEKIPVIAMQRELLVMLLESEVQANDMRNRILSGEDFGELAAKYSLHTKSKDNKGDIGWHPKGAVSGVTGSSVLDDAVFGIGVGELSQPVVDTLKSKNIGYWLFKVLEKTGEEAKVQVMVLGSEKEAQDIRARLEAGEDFVTLAKEFSQMPGAKSDGGDLGLIKKGERGSFFDTHIFDPNIVAPALSQPIFDDVTETKGGCWLIKVLGEENGKIISNDDRGTMRLMAYYDWQSSLVNDPSNKVENYLTDELRTWAMEAASRENRELRGKSKQ